MEISFRNYVEGDISKISSFLGRITTEEDRSKKITWDCFSKHPCSEMFQPEKMGIWEDEGEIVGVVRLESPWVGGVIIDVHPDYTQIHKDMIQYAEKTFKGVDGEGSKYLNVYLCQGDKLEERLAIEGYNPGNEGRMLKISLDEEVPGISIPKDFQLCSLDKVYNFDKLSDLLWRGFNYDGEPPAFDDDVYLPKKHAWLDFRREICVVAVAPEGNFASFCGMWFDQETKAAFIEPLATAKEYRSLGLARACIYKAMEKCKELGANVVYVEADEVAIDWYKKIGFKQAFKNFCWTKKL